MPPASLAQALGEVSVQGESRIVAPDDVFALSNLSTDDALRDCFDNRQNGKTSTKLFSDTHPNVDSESMIILLHVAAPQGQVIDGTKLKSLLKQCDYHYGEKKIFHSLNQGRIVFSVVKMVKPGTFDINNPASFNTPGISLILTLPAPIEADVAFEALLNSAAEMAETLGCVILDSERKILNRRTIQHLRHRAHKYIQRHGARLPQQ